MGADECSVIFGQGAWASRGLRHAARLPGALGRVPAVIATGLALAAAGASAADSFAPTGAKATLSVEFVYESAGKKQDKYDLHEWKVSRTISAAAELVAQAPQPLPAMHKPDAQQMADLGAKQAKGQAAAAKMAPLMDSVEKIMAKCGDNEACITRETQKLGFGMAGTPQMDTAMSAVADIEAASKPGAPRYQVWRATTLKGSYAIDETTHIVHADSICVALPRQRCTRDEVRKGAGAMPLPPEAAKNPKLLAGSASFEVDVVKNTLTLALPGPLWPLGYTETITTDEPAGTHSVPTPKGPQPRSMVFRVGDSGAASTGKPWTVPLQGGWRSQSGEQVVMLTGNAGEGGKLTVRWRLQQ
jgi:hypothetical protein